MNANAGDVLSLMSWLLIAGAAFAGLIWFVVLQLDRIERERREEARRSGGRSS